MEKLYNLLNNNNNNNFCCFLRLTFNFGNREECAGETSGVWGWLWNDRSTWQATSAQRVLSAQERCRGKEASYISANVPVVFFFTLSRRPRKHADFLIHCSDFRN